MNKERKEELVQYACDHQMMLLAIYHEKARHFTVMSLFRTQAGLLRMSAYDSTHGDEETPRTYKIEELEIMGLTRVRPVRTVLRGEG